MASAQDYARWIVENRAKRGTPDFDTVARAYEAAKAAEGMQTSVTSGAQIPTGNATAPAYTGSNAEMARLQRGEPDPSIAQRVLGVGETALTALTAPLGLAGGVVGGVAGAGEALLTGQPFTDTVATRAGQGAKGMMILPKTQAGQEMVSNVADSEAMRQLQALGPMGMTATAGTRAVGMGASTAAQMAGAATPRVSQAVESIKAGRAAKQAATQAVNSGAQQTVKAAEALGVPIMTTDVAPPSTFVGRAVQTFGERVPGAGTGGARAEQQTARIDAVRQTLKDYGADDAAALSDDVMRDLAGKRSADLKKYADMKNGVIDAADQAGPANVPRTVAAIDQEIAKLAGLNSEAVSPAIKQLEDFRGAIQGQGLRNIEELRKQLGESFKDPQLAAVRSSAEKATGRIYGALKEDMREAILANGGKRDVLKWEVANKRLSEMAGELGSNALKSALNKGGAEPEQVRKLLFSSKPSEVRLLYKNLTPEGRASARAAILQEAAKKAGGEALSPTRFANEVSRLGESVGVFFTKEDRSAIDGLTRVLNATRRAGEFAANPPTGAQLYPAVGAAALTDIFGGFGAGIVSGLSLGAVARMYESKAIRNMLISMPKQKPGSREELSLVNKILSSIRGVPNKERP